MNANVYEDVELEAWYSNVSGTECIRIGTGPLHDRRIVELDIRDAVFLQWQLAGAIDDYAKAAGK